MVETAVNPTHPKVCGGSAEQKLCGEDRFDYRPAGITMSGSVAWMTTGRLPVCRGLLSQVLSRSDSKETLESSR